MGQGRDVFVDKEYRTMLGLGFYNRLRELAVLEEKLQSVRTLVVYGPRNVGKSELVKYFISRRLQHTPLAKLFNRVVLIDARRRRAEPYLGEARIEPRGLLDELLGVAGLPRGLVGLLEELASRIRPPVFVFIDEFHLLFGAGLGEALSALEAVAGFLAKRGEEVARLVVTVSEGFFATTRALYRLLGYSTGFMLVEPMDPASFQALYREYHGKYNCSIGFETLLGLVDASPGYLVDLCPRSRSSLEEWLRDELYSLDTALDSVGEETGLSREEALRAAAKLLSGEPAKTTKERMIGEKLVEANIAYPCPSWPRLYLPQLPLYKAALDMMIDRGFLDASQLRLEDLVATRPRRCHESR